MSARSLGTFVPGSEVDAEREDLHVEAPTAETRLTIAWNMQACSADRAAGERFKRPGSCARAGAIGRRGLEVRAGGARVRDRGC